MADNLEIIQCPACGKDMVKVYMPSAGINLDVCVNGCGGIYFDNREYKKFDENKEDITPLIEVLEGKNFSSVDESSVRECPFCGTNMVKNFASVKHEVEVDECYGCGGKFLDYKELEIIRGQYETEEQRAEAVIKDLYSKVGVELRMAEMKHKENMSKPSMLTRLIRFKNPY